MKKLSKILLVTVFLLTALLDTKAMETVSGSVSASLNTSSVVLGNQVTLYVTLKCDSGVGGARVLISFDSSYLSISSYDSPNATFNGTNLFLVEPTNNSSITIKVVFTSIKIGNTSISVNTSQFIDYEDGNYIGSYNESIGNSLEIKAKTNNNTGGGSSSGGSSGGSSTTTLSSDASLYSLKLKNGNFEESFTSDKFSYTVYADDKIESLDIEAVCSSSKASYTIKNNELKEGWNEVVIVCTAEDKSTKEYTIKVYVEETPTIFYQENKLGVVKNLDKVSDIDGFERKEEVIENNNLVLFEHNDLTLIYLVDEYDNKDFYVFDKVNDQVICKYRPIEIDGKKYISVDFDYEDFSQLETELKKSKYRFDSDTTLNCWSYKASNMSDYRIFYLMDEDGHTSLYSYETSEKTMQKYTLPINEETIDNSSLIKETVYLCCGIAGLVCLLLSTVMVVKKSK